MYLLNLPAASMVAGEYWAELTGSVELLSTSGKGNKVKKITEKMKTIEEKDNFYFYLEKAMIFSRIHKPVKVSVWLNN